MNEGFGGTELRKALRRTLVQAIPELDASVDESIFPSETLNSLAEVLLFLEDGTRLVQDPLTLQGINACIAQCSQKIREVYPFVDKLEDELLTSERENYPALVQAKNGLLKASRIVDAALQRKSYKHLL